MEREAGADCNSNLAHDGPYTHTYFWHIVVLKENRETKRDVPYAEIQPGDVEARYGPFDSKRAMRRFLHQHVWKGYGLVRNRVIVTKSYYPPVPSPLPVTHKLPRPRHQ